MQSIKCYTRIEVVLLRITGLIDAGNQFNILVCVHCTCMFSIITIFGHRVTLINFISFMYMLYMHRTVSYTHVDI